MSAEVGWGLIGAGDTSARFAQGLRHVPGAKLVCTWTRRFAAAEAFAAAHGGEPARTLELLLEQPIDAVYIATHPDSHQEYSLVTLRAGKHVLCEKPSMLDEAELNVVLGAAKRYGLLFMEALKTPFFPMYRRLREHLRQDPIGELRFVRAGSSIDDVPPGHPIYDVQAVVGEACWASVLTRLFWLSTGSDLRNESMLSDGSGGRGSTRLPACRSSICVGHLNSIVDLISMDREMRCSRGRWATWPLMPSGGIR